MRNLKSCLFFFAILLCAIFSYQKAFADTEINGDIIDSNTTWTKDLGPYNVHISPFIMDGATLTIEPGVLVKFDSGQSLEIFGSLIADGTDAEKVIFTGDSGWSGIDVSTGGSADFDIVWDNGTE